MPRLIHGSSPWSRARTGEPLLWLTGCGHEIVTPDQGYHYDCRERGDIHVGLQLTLRGEGFYERAGRTVALPQGTAFFDRIPGDFRYGYPRGATADYEFVWIDIDGAEAERWLKEINRSAGPVLTLGAENPVGPLMLALAHEQGTGLALDRYQVSARVYEILMTVLSVLNRARLTTSPLVQQALRSMHQRGLREGWDVSTLAGELGCSREHLARAFADAIGVPPGEYLLQHRLRRAQDELRASNDGLDAIARRCGFAGANYFCRVFRKRFGITPTAFRSRPWVVRTGET
jgi:AraC-like DNA-binding protein